MKGLAQTSPASGKRTFEGAEYVTPRDQAILIERLSNGLWLPKFYRGGLRGVFSTYTSFLEAEKAVVKYIKTKVRNPKYPGIYPDIYKDA